MILNIVGVLALIGAGIYLCDLIYRKIAIKKARNEGIFRDDRRQNDWR
jgi:ribosomal protein L13E